MIQIPYDFQGTFEHQKYSELEVRFKEFLNYEIIGKDQSGVYDMFLISLGDRSKPCIFLTASMHGTEWHTTQYSLALMEQLRDNEFPDNELRDYLLDNFHIAYIPIINPWGLDNNDDIYQQFSNPYRYTYSGTELNRDFYHYSQAETRNVVNQIRRFQPFAYVDMHMFQQDYNVAYGRKFIMANGQRETDDIRDVWRQSFESYAGEEMTVWTNTLALDSGLARAFASRQYNPWTPHTLAYITEFVRPARIDGEIISRLSIEEIYKYGLASLYIFFRTSIDYYNEFNGLVDTISTPSKTYEITRRFDGDMLSVDELKGNGVIKTTFVRDEEGFVDQLERTPN